MSTDGFVSQKVGLVVVCPESHGWVVGSMHSSPKWLKMIDPLFSECCLQMSGPFSLSGMTLLMSIGKFPSQKVWLGESRKSQVVA